MREKLTAIIRQFIILTMHRENAIRRDRKPVLTADLSLDELATFLIKEGIVIPVRCRECKHCESFTHYDWNEYYSCLLGAYEDVNDFAAIANHYCSYGEPKEIPEFLKKKMNLPKEREETNDEA